MAAINKGTYHVASSYTLWQAADSTERTAIVAAEGDRVYQVDVDGWYIRQNSAWMPLVAFNPTYIKPTYLDASNIPTADPVSAGQVWADSGVLKVSAGV